ncbi:helix-turn-helix domain-containing protein [Longimicrobium sp.]|uniref:AraC family transcriptional regulator n=1 Tax=Longimicrobium sp. TaxID=2029185 RepID=UPI003B3AA4B3
MATSLPDVSAKPRPVLAMEPELVPVFETAGAPFSVTGHVPWTELDAWLRRAPASTVVVVNPYAGIRGDRFPRVRDLLRGFPSVPVVAAMELRPEMVGDVALLLEWGVSEVVALGTESTPRALAARLRQAHVRPLKRALEAALSPYAGAEARQILLAAAEVAAEGGLAPELAARLGVTARTLTVRCARADLPAPRQVQTWLRVLLACKLLDDPARTVYGAAYASGYQTERSLRRAITTFLGVDSTTLRKAGAFGTAAAAFNAALRDARETARERRRV